MLMFRSADLGAEHVTAHDVLARFLRSAAERQAVEYRAFRRLEASSPKVNSSGWVEAITEFDPRAGMRYRIVAEGGAGRIRGVLKGVLDAEREATHPGRSGNAALTPENYEFQPGPADADGLIAVRVKPRRRDAALVDGTICVTAPHGDLVRIEGRLAKNPSFWTRSVDVVRRYERRAGALVPVEVRSVADVKLAGPSSFVMRYDYEIVNGQATRDEEPTFLLARLSAGVRSPRE
jgi:hypothetical protein